MKKFIKNLLLFCLFLIPAYLVILGIYGFVMPAHLMKNMSKPGLSGFTFTKFRDVKKFKDVDVLIVGSSHAYRGFDTRNFEKHGIKVFNFGTSAQSPYQSRILLEEYVEKLNPKMVFFEVRPAGFSSDGVESAADIISTDAFSEKYLEMAMETNHIKVYNTFGYSLIRSVFNLDKNFKEKQKSKGDTYISGGFVEKELKFNKPRKAGAKDKYEFSDLQKGSFEKAIQFLKARKIPFVMIQAPITSQRYNSVTNNAETDAYFRSLGTYYNFNEMMHLNDSTDFFDEHHLNQNGANAFDEFLIQKLKQDKIIR